MANSSNPVTFEITKEEIEKHMKIGFEDDGKLEDFEKCFNDADTDKVSTSIFAL